MAVAVAPRPKLTWWDRTYFPALTKGLWITLKYLVRKKVTRLFPEEKPVFPEGYRGYPKLVIAENGLPKCVACKLCEVVCPPIAITIRIGEHAQPDERERLPAEFVIDMGRCIVCGLCEEACPVDAIVMSDVHVMSTGSRKSIVFKKDLLMGDYHTIETMRP